MVAFGSHDSSPGFRSPTSARLRALLAGNGAHPIICISRNDTGPYAGEVWVTAGNQTTMESSDNGLFRLKKQNGV